MDLVLKPVARLMTLQAFLQLTRKIYLYVTIDKELLPLTYRGWTKSFEI